MADKIQFRRDTAARWAQYNPVLMEGEVGYVLDDPNQYKIGDGVHAWNELPLRGFDGTLVHELGDSETAAMSQGTVTKQFVNKIYNYYTQDGYIDTNGGYISSTSNNRKCSLFIPLNKDCSIIVHGLSTDGCNLISFYSKDKEFISGYSGLQYHNITVEIQKDDFPSNAEYVRVSGQGNDTDFLINMSLCSLISYINNDYKEARVEKLRLKVIDYSEYSTIKVSGGAIIHLNNNRRYGLPVKDFSINNRELLYIDIDSESPDILTANYINDWAKLYNRNILVLAYRDSERVTGGLLYEKYIGQQINKNLSTPFFLSTENKVVTKDFTLYSTISLSGSVRIFTIDNTDFYVNYIGDKEISLNNFEVAYVDISSISTPFHGNTDNLFEIKVESFVGNFTHSNKIILAYRDSLKVVYSAFNEKDIYRDNVFVLTTADISIIDGSDSSSVSVRGSNYRVYTKDKNFYVNVSTDIILSNFEAACVNLNNVPSRGTTENAVDIEIINFSSISSFANYLVLAYRDSERVTGGLLYEKYIGQQMADVESILTENVDYDLTENHYININGQVLETASNSGYSNPIELFRGETIRVYASGSPANSIISVTDSKGLSYRSAVASVGGGIAWYEYTAIEDCYVAVSFVINDRNKVVKNKFTSGVKWSDNTLMDSFSTPYFNVSSI